MPIEWFSLKITSFLFCSEKDSVIRIDQLSANNKKYNKEILPKPEPELPITANFTNPITNYRRSGPTRINPYLELMLISSINKKTDLTRPVSLLAPQRMSLRWLVVGVLSPEEATRFHSLDHRFQYLFS
jgi:hypothetical protein